MSAFPRIGANTTTQREYRRDSARSRRLWELEQVLNEIIDDTSDRTAKHTFLAALTTSRELQADIVRRWE